MVCAFPYILGITHESVEFRYAINGSLLQTLCMPELKLLSAKVGFQLQCWTKIFGNLVTT